ncbi:MAG: sensor domain-containing diguanylate cyclase, partial [Actinomycetota bacterium]|nr:sensor domain-containing diguanylate cyclase [Actinomycetota bacterium]
LFASASSPIPPELPDLPGLPGLPGTRATVEVARVLAATSCAAPAVVVDDDPLPPADVCRQLWANDTYGRVVLEADGTVRWLNTVAATMTGYDGDAVVGRSMAEFIAPADVAVAIEAVTEIQGEESVADEGVPLVLALVRADGSLVQVEIGAENFLDVPGINGISLRIRPYDSQRFLERFLIELAEGAPLGPNLELLVRSLDHLIQESASVVLHGWDGSAFTEAVTVGVPPALLTAVRTSCGAADDLPWMRCRLSGATEWSAVTDLPERVRAAASRSGLQACWARPIIVPTGGAVAVVVVWRRLPSFPRVGHRHALERSCQAAALAFAKRLSEHLLVRAATVDALTGIPNRSQFFASLELSMDTSEPGRLGVLYLDLDGFKPVNDTYGHRVGDRLLATIGARLGANVRPGDMVARLGGDEFAVLCREVDGEAELVDVAQRLIDVVARPVTLDGLEIKIGVSIGVAVAKVHGQTHDEVLDAADAALYRAKRAGRGRYRIALPS